MSGVVDAGGGRQDASDVPTLSELIKAHRDVRGTTYEEMSRRTGHAISPQALNKLVLKRMLAFPEPRTIIALSDLLDLPVATILDGCARSLGLPVRSTRSALEVVLPPGTDALTPEDREAIRMIIRALINARRAADPPDLVRPDQPVWSDLELAARRRRKRDTPDTPGQ